MLNAERIDLNLLSMDERLDRNLVGSSDSIYCHCTGWILICDRRGAVKKTYILSGHVGQNPFQLKCNFFWRNKNVRNVLKCKNMQRSFQTLYFLGFLNLVNKKACLLLNIKRTRCIEEKADQNNACLH